jgi:hypothetical protein
MNERKEMKGVQEKRMLKDARRDVLLRASESPR